MSDATWVLCYVGKVNFSTGGCILNRQKGGSNHPEHYVRINLIMVKIYARDVQFGVKR